MEKFLALNIEKQERIISSGMKVFGTVGYKKASISDISKEANVSKASIFLYFNSKKEFYFYLIEYANKTILEKFSDNKIFEIESFFEKIEYATITKMKVLKKMPYVMKFLTVMYFEKDPEVYEDIKKTIENSNTVKNYFVLTNMDKKMFKDGIDPEMVLKILLRWTEGYLQGIMNGNNINLDELLVEFQECLDLMKNNFLKEEYIRKS
ncbi:MAG: TetR/AcrR family transcriptional regulator [Lachnospirales bacterium]